MANRKNIILITLSVVALGFAVKTVFRGKPVSPAISRTDLPADLEVRKKEQREKKAAYEARDAQLRSAPSISHDEIDRFPTLIDRYIHPPPDEPERLTRQARAALVETLQRYASAWLADSPDEYITIVRSEKTHWYPADHRMWKIVGGQLTQAGQPPDDPADPLGTLRRLLEIRKYKPGNRWVRLAINANASIVLTDYRRTRDSIVDSMLPHGKIDQPNTSRYWMLGAAQGIRLRDPIKLPVDVLREHRGVLTAEAYLTFLDFEDRPSIWGSFWYWDPDTGDWLNAISSGHGKHFESSFVCY